MKNNPNSSAPSPGKSTFRQYKYKCHKNKCGKVTEHYAWSNEINITTQTCTCGSHMTVKNLHVDAKVEAPGIRTPTKNR